MLNIIVGLCMLFLLLSAIHTFMSLAYDIQEQNISNIRLQQLKKLKTKEKVEFKELMDKIAESANEGLMPKLRQYFPSIGKTDIVKLQRNLYLAGWDDTFTAETFIACVWALRCVGVILLPISLLFLKNELLIVGIAASALCMGGLEMWLKSGVSDVKSELFAEFPDFIRIVSGYLSADMELVISINNSIRYVSDAWAKILKTFVIDCENKNIEIALDRMDATVDMFEIKEFISLIKLTLEQGGKAKDGFLDQADKIAELQKNQLTIKVGKRKTMATMIQMPLLLLNMVIIALPVLMNAIGSMGEIGLSF